MFTLSQLTKALPSLMASFQTFDHFESLSIKHVSCTHVYSTAGAAEGAVAILEIGRKNPNHVPGRIDAPTIQFCSMYIFPDGHINSYFMRNDAVYRNTSDYVNHVKNWLALIRGA